MCSDMINASRLTPLLGFAPSASAGPEEEEAAGTCGCGGFCDAAGAGDPKSNSCTCKSQRWQCEIYILN